MVDSEPLSRQAWQDVLTGYGCELDDVTYEKIVGLRLDDTAQLLRSVYDLPVNPVELAKQKETRLYQIFAYGIPTMPGLMRLVQALSVRNLPWAVATSSRLNYAQYVLLQLNLLAECQAIAAGDQVSQGKPAPDIYWLAAERLGVTASTCLALEDSVPGAQAAIAAGMTTVAVPNGHTKPADFDFVDYVFKSLFDVADALDQLVGNEWIPAL